MPSAPAGSERFARQGSVSGYGTAAAGATFMKVGQNPKLEITIPKEFGDALGKKRLVPAWPQRHRPRPGIAHLTGIITDEQRLDIVKHACPGAGACGGIYTASLFAPGYNIPSASTNLSFVVNDLGITPSGTYGTIPFYVNAWGAYPLSIYYTFAAQ